jgi:uncharacterized membrane protein YfcA
MTAGIAEIVGAFLVFVGLCTVVAGAAMVSTVLAVLVAGAFVVLAGVLAIYVALQLDRRAAAAAAAEPKAGTRS